MKEFIQGSPEWKALRMNKIGASDAAAIMGISKWTTPYQLWEQKLGFREVEMNSAMQRGHDLEEEARQCFERIYSILVFPDVVFHPEHEFLMASLDGIDIERKVLVEIKNVNRHDHQSALDGKVPEHYYPQCQHQLAVTGLPFMYYFSYDPLNPATVIVPRDDSYIADMIEKEKEFYRYMTEFEAPLLTDRDYVEHNDSQWEIYADDFLAAQKIRKEWEDKENYYRKRLIELAQEKNSKGHGIRLTRFIRRGNIQYDKIAELQGVDLEPYRKPPIESWRICETDE